MASSTLELNGGTLEVRSDAATVATGKNVYLSNGSNVFVDRAVGGTGLNGTVTFGALTFLDNENMAFNGRNGYGMSFTTSQITSTVDGPTTFTNNLSGLLSFTGNFWNYTETDTARTFTIAGNGNTTINGNILATGTTHSITKTGTGTLTLSGTGSTYTGATNINGGTLAISDFRAITNNTAAINIGTTTTAGTLSIVGNNLSLANVTTSKVINLAGTTGGATILANQTGTSPGLVLNANFTATGAGAKTLTLGGANVQDNTINGIIVDSTAATAVSKTGSGTWVLAGSNSYTGTTSILEGTLKLKANAASSTIINDLGLISLGLASNVQNSGGILEFVGQAGVNSVETLGTLIPATGATTIKLTPGAGGSASLVFNFLGTVAGGTGVNVVGSTGSNTVTITSASGFINPHIYFAGADFAYATAGVLRAPNYGVDVGTNTTASGPLVASSNNQVTGNIGGINTATISGLKILGSNTLTLNASQTLTIQYSVGAAGGIMVTGGSAVITGGSGITTGGAGDLVIRVDGVGDSLTLNSVVTSSTTGGLTKNGAGTLIIAGVNAQTGTTNINEGTVQLSGSGRLSGANVTTNVRTGAMLDLNGVSTGTAIGQFNGGGTITNSSVTAATLQVGNNNGTGIFSGTINDGPGVIHLTKVGTGAQTWSGLSTYSGVTTIGSTGLVSVTSLANIGTDSSIGRGNATSATTNAASLVFDGTTGGLNYTGSASVSIDRLFTLNGSAASSGAQIANASAINAALIFSNTGAIRFGANATVAQNLILGGASTADNQFNLQITDNVLLKTSVNKTGAGLWILGGANNTYTGTTTISDGILVAQDGS
ncbi:MAG: beta strand repeat-containing protein, partial [Roseimicrobium sp.]